MSNIIPHGGSGNVPFLPINNLPGFEIIEDCKLCNSKWKEEAHELYEKTQNMNKVFRFLTEDRQEVISYGAVRNHLRFHFEAKATNAMIKEYATEVDAWLDLQMDQMTALRRAMAMLEREMMIIASQGEGLPLPERRKNVDTMTKLGALLLNYRSKVEEMESGKDPIILILDQLRSVLRDEMKLAKGEEAQRLVKNVLNKMKDSFGHIDVIDAK
jgi:hypothetical protein